METTTISNNRGVKVGYARVSSTGQNLESQIEALNKVGCTRIFQEKKSGKQTDNRNELKNALDYVREGDEFYVTRLDRVARSTKDLYNILDTLSDKGVGFKATEQQLDTTTATGKLMIGILGTIAEFETDLRAERQADGIKSAIKRGVKFGAKKKVNDEQIKEIIEIKSKHNAPTNQELADGLGISRNHLLKLIASYKLKNQNS